MLFAFLEIKPAEKSRRMLTASHVQHQSVQHSRAMVSQFCEEIPDMRQDFPGGDTSKILNPHGRWTSKG